MNVETLLWIGGLIIEMLVVAALVLALLLRRSWKARQQLLAQLEATSHPPGEAASAVEAPTVVDEPTAASESPRSGAVAVEIAASDWMEGNNDATDPARLEGSTERLQQRLDVSNETLLRLESSGAMAAHPEIATLKNNLQGMTSEIDSLQESSAMLRQDMTALRDKLRHSEIDVRKLQAEKDVLAAEYEALNLEYERIYASSDESSASEKEAVAAAPAKPPHAS